MNWIKQNWKWILLVVIIIIIFVAVKYKNRPIAVKIPDTKQDTKQETGTSKIVGQGPAPSGNERPNALPLEG